MSTPLTRDLIVVQTRALKLPGVARTFEPLAGQARDAHWPHEDDLHEVLSAEQASRHESVIRQRLREARFPEVKTLETFDFAAAEGVKRHADPTRSPTGSGSRRPRISSSPAPSAPARPIWLWRWVWRRRNRSVGSSSSARPIWSGT